MERDAQPVARRSRAGDVASLVAAWGLAVVAPLLERLASNSPLLLHHRFDALDLAILLVALVAAPPWALLGVTRLTARLVGVAVGVAVFRAVLGLLFLAFALQVTVAFGVSSPAIAIAAGLAGVCAIAAGWLRYPASRAFVRAMALAVPVVVVWFLARPDILGLVVGELVRSHPRVAVASSTPVVLVVLDELPLSSLLDAEGGVDARSFPGFARLAASSTWYRNASTTSPRTEEAVVTILSGVVAPPRTAPILDHYPRNLFTLLDRDYDVRARETLTQLLPPGRRPPRTWRSRARNLASMLGDLTIVWLHRVTPAGLADRLPPIDQAWGNFLRLDVGGTRAGRRLAVRTEDPLHRRETLAAFLAGLAPPRDGRGSLDFLHVLLPHPPFTYLPSGRLYGGPPAYRGPVERAWAEDRYFAEQLYLRHLLQLAFLDGFIGDLIDRLQALGAWDDALVVVTADHGAGFWPGHSRRRPEGRAGDPWVEDILRIPLFLKLPGQAQGRVDERDAQIADILPTVAEVLGVDPGWVFDGVSLLGPAPARAKFLRLRSGEAIFFPPGYVPPLASAERKLRLFGDAGPRGWPAFAPLAAWHERPVGPLPRGDQEPAEIDLDQRAAAAVPRGERSWALVELTGALRMTPAPAGVVAVVAAVDGIVAATGEALVDERGEGRFSILLPEAREPGPGSRLELLIVRGHREGEPAVVASTSPLGR